MIKQIPNTLTLLNLVAGFAATICSVKGYNEYAAFCIMAGMLLDFSDGFAARLLKAYSSIGKDLDSLADVVTFGVAPGAILFSMLVTAGMATLPAFAVAALIPAASGLRLAIFNNDTTQSNSFRGLATPASAFIVVSFVLSAAYSDSPIYDTLTASPWFLSILSLTLAVMMLIRTRMFSLKITGMQWKGNEERYVFAVAVILLLLLFRVDALPLIMALYIAISFISALIRRRATTPLP
ncbi:MAG: CDP-alcohol phosphatidyltransferase family protein [Bacteroidales bacterium]|nr:CDP-alcohol phosphatidyltransferase family protein [Bacteroidales bacterium]MDT8374538.1 CDP-alcohol phosphatidyltransferase family protein [Bacteroidales bacterium]